MAKHIIQGQIDPDPTIRDVLEEVDLVGQKLDRALNRVQRIMRKQRELASSIADVQSTLDEKD